MRRIYASGVRKSAEKKIRTKDKSNNRMLGKLHNEELQNSYFSPDIIKTLKSTRTKWAENCGKKT
jgi:hypothetical protein